MPTLEKSNMITNSPQIRQSKKNTADRTGPHAVTCGNMARTVQSASRMAGQKNKRRDAVTFESLRDLPIGTDARPPLQARAPERAWGRRARETFRTLEGMREAAAEARRLGSHGYADLLDRELVRWSAESTIDST